MLHLYEYVLRARGSSLLLRILREAAAFLAPVQKQDRPTDRRGKTMSQYRGICLSSRLTFYLLSTSFRNCPVVVLPTFTNLVYQIMKREDLLVLSSHRGGNAVKISYSDVAECAEEGLLGKVIRRSLRGGEREMGWGDGDE